MARSNVKQPNQQSRQIVSAQWQGPLPPPEALANFDSIIPNGAERIMKMVEDEQAHRISYEKAHLNALAGDTRRGHYIGLAISVASIAGAVYAASLGAHWSVSIALVGVPILGIIRAIVGSKTNGTK